MKAINNTPVKHSTNGAAPKGKTARHRAPAETLPASEAAAPVATETVTETATETVTETATAVEPSPELQPSPAAQTLPDPETPPDGGDGGTTSEEGEGESEGASTPVVKHRQRVEHYDLAFLVRQQINSVRALDPVLAAFLAERGVTEAYLTALESQLETTLLALAARQASMKTEQDAIDAMEMARLIVQDALGTLRVVARTVTNGADGDLTQLHLNDPLPRRTDRLIAHARGAFTGAQAEPYASLLATAAYPPEAVEAALTAVTVLEQLTFARGQAHQAAMQATETRDRTVRDLRRAVRPLRVQMRAVLRRHPEYVAPLGF